MQTKLPVAILGATGPVGQKVIAMLNDHPKLYVAELAASDGRAGQVYGHSVEWRESKPLPEAVSAMKLKAMADVKSPYVISALPAEVAQEAEPMLAARGQNVFSNASAFRMEADVPLLIPEVNPEHLALIDRQKTPGKIVTNPNCSTVNLVGALKPLQELGKLKHVSVVTMQSLSGAGYPGVPSFDLIGNVIPHIGGEEEKIEAECRRILGSPDAPADFGVTCHVHRVPVHYGHVVAIHAEFDRPVSPAAAREIFIAQEAKHPGIYVLHEKKDRPQPLRDLNPYDMRFHVGRIKQGARPEILGLICLGHNLVRGAAGAALGNLEFFLERHSQ